MASDLHRWPRLHWSQPPRHRWKWPIVCTAADPLPRTGFSLNRYPVSGKVVGVILTRKGRKRYVSWVWPVYITVGANRRLRWIAEETPRAR